jgi:hypothetical protein
LLHLDDVAWLSESQLCDLPQVVERARGSRLLFADGVALQRWLRAVVKLVAQKLPPGDRRSERIHFTLAGVLEGRSIAALARERGKTREYWSRAVWRQAIQLVAQELLRLEARREA